MPSRKFLLLGVAVIGGVAMIADRSLLSEASAGLDQLGSVVESAREAQSIAASLSTNDPMAIQGLLDTLAAKEGVVAGEADPDLFGLARLVAAASGEQPGTPDPLDPGSTLLAAAGIDGQPLRDPGLGERRPDDPTLSDVSLALAQIPSEPRPTEGRVTMVMTSTSGGVAMIDGLPVRAGETARGLTLLRVHEDGVTVRENDTEHFLALR